ncbi:predicted protein [Aspergillus terreus NIH2624]|uniref:Protein root UVB sensitive/RUS domain-containing protein n=1 Tax=Aspergillus terreus (strain NIH 2624 / FGSC A1156) TaxID=341663 RepID=Q0CTS6_ASPTN|nr:uncharacterized protein ATEG_02908 [Aspergillus terreus NIH2624]EAU36182.1 predicted protein [Aspergillus terreus NIH2624]
MPTKPSSNRITFTEVDEVNHPTATYIYSADGQNGRVDIVLPPHNSQTWSLRALKTLLIEVFLPAGYPHSVTDDYTAYQIFDSLQAFSSSIAGLLSSRAVLQGVGVGNPNASPTSALLLHILQDTSGRLATILFAHRVGTALQPECKSYRLAADLFNDLAMILDCLSPAAPAGAPRVAVLSAAGVLRALCGVAGALNYAAVRAVQMTSLNRQRANIVFATLLDADPALRALALAPQVSGPADGRGVLSPAQVAAREAIFERDGVLRWSSAAAAGPAPVLGVCRIGVSVGEFLRWLGGAGRAGVPLGRLQEAFRAEAYILFLAGGNAAILLKRGCTPRAQLKAWMHALLAARVLGDMHEAGDETERAFGVVESTLRFLDQTRVDGYLDALTRAGWDVDLAALETRPGRRIICE